MDTQVKYILLLMVATIICVGVSVGIKYDKSSIKTHPQMPHAHIPDDNYSGLSEDIQNRITILQSQLDITNPEVESLNSKLNNIIPILNSNGGITLETGEPTLADINKLFISESINETTLYGIYKNEKFVVTENNGLFQINVKFNDNNGNNFNFDNNGFLQNVSHEYLIFDEIPSATALSTTSPKLQDAYGKYVLKLINAGVDSGNFSLAIIKLLTIPVTTQLYNLEYFGLTTDVNYPVPFSPKKYIKNTDPFSLNTIPQTSDSFTPNGFGMFASVLPTAPINETAAQSAPTLTFYDGTNLIGFTASIDTDRYAISVLKSSILNSGSIPKDYQMNIPANTTSYTIPANGALFYSINLLFLDNPDIDISNVAFVDTNNIKGVQNVLFVISKNTEDPIYSMLERNIVGQDLSNALSIYKTITTKQLYNYYSGQRIIKCIFFNPCIVESSGKEIAMFPVKYKSRKFYNPFRDSVRKLDVSNSSPGPQTYKYFDSKYYPYYYNEYNNKWSSP